MLRKIKKIIPKSVFELFQPAYHYTLALLGAIIYRFPGKKIVVIGVTGTKGKTTVVEIVNSILEAAEIKTAIASTLRFKIGENNERNMFKMTMPGRFFMQQFLRKAVDQGCSHAVIEMTSEGAKQFRHKFIYPGILIFTNLAPEHIESHGSYEKYLDAKLSIGRELEGRDDAAIISNIDDKEGEKFLSLNIKHKIPYSIQNAFAVKTNEKGSSFQVDKLVIHSKLPGIFNVRNMLAAIAYAKFAGLSEDAIKKGLENLNMIRGRMEKIECGQKFDAVVDYAHTADSLEAVYKTYSPTPKDKGTLICVLGATGGGRDKWKREEMGKMADKYCTEIILTNEDPYDEDPIQIIEGVKKGIKKKLVTTIIDRREAINKALSEALALSENFSEKSKIAVLITGKGTDPYIMEKDGQKTPWDDASVVREELSKIMNKKS